MHRRAFMTGLAVAPLAATAGWAMPAHDGYLNIPVSLFDGLKYDGAQRLAMDCRFAALKMGRKMRVVIEADDQRTRIRGYWGSGAWMYSADQVVIRAYDTESYTDRYIKNRDHSPVVSAMTFRYGLGVDSPVG